ncbi:MAG: ribonuclease III [Desulfobulbaceae bacterium]|uniref:Ribonuclease 3 n=1 Tax=Candidatus Desulfatifera sulfidica TaxID=2841691 RepID=A0A8J6TAS2_9BACT|nr:ribonuclease III [Candidatus Desulfatifera sulfidica]
MFLDSLARQNKKRLAELEQIIGYRFTDLRLLQKALIHSSFAFEQSQVGNDNETLEFLGDAVLDLTVGYILFQNYPVMREGELTRLRSSLVNESHLAVMARDIDLGSYLHLGKGEEASSGRNKPSILSCAYEAVVGAIFEDGGYKTANAFVRQFFIPAIGSKKEELLIADAKSRLQEALQEKFNEAPSYRLDLEEGPSHEKVFTVSVVFRKQALATGTAGSKKEAEQRAAATALAGLDELLAGPLSV